MRPIRESGTFGRSSARTNDGTAQEQMSMSDEQRLVQAAQRGDTAALESLLAGQQSRVFRFALKMCRLREDAEEVLQDTLLAAVRTLGQYRGDAALSTWLYTIARSFCIKRRRRTKFAPAALISLDGEEARAAREAPDPRRAPDEALAERQVTAALGRAMDALAPAYREVLVLRDVEGLPAAEVADVMGLSVEAVKSRLHRARTSVRRAMAPLLGGRVGSHRPGGCPDIAALFSRHLEGDISPTVCARMERHLAGCQRCQGICASLRETLKMCSAVPAPRVPASVKRAVKKEIRSLLSQDANPRSRARLSRREE
jgi:RNA polymerase sigma-70 factor, ECF subfamily